MTATDGERAFSAREEVLLRSLDDTVELGLVHECVAQANPDEVLSVVQEKTLGLIRSLVDDGLFEIGDEGNGLFVVWDLSVDEAIRRIRDVYVGQFDDQDAWYFFSRLKPTVKGEQVAEGLGENAGYFAPPSAEEIHSEQQRLASAASLVGVLADYVDDLSVIDAGAVPMWLTQLDLPARWQFARADYDGVGPARFAVYGPQADGRWSACETLALFSFTGCPPAQVVYDNSACTLRDLRAPLGDALSFLEPTITEPLSNGFPPDMIAVRTSGSFVFCQRWMWAQFNTYIACSAAAGQSRMLQQVLYVDSTLQKSLAADIAYLGHTVRQVFTAAASAP
ncbi:hypothetical protein [Mycolicibacter sinensis]|uniref:hypothetical protein n=1 Tax=Mycolicibacter sinensis (strain JDM601) TaxID=875328 RepID=UPI00104275A0|nr:hypothetical protein [Mycolicibacter sinensis]